MQYPTINLRDLTLLPVLPRIAQQERLHAIEKMLPAILHVVGLSVRDHFSFATQPGEAADERLTLWEWAEGSMHPRDVLCFHALTDTQIESRFTGVIRIGDRNRNHR